MTEPNTQNRHTRNENCVTLFTHRQCSNQNNFLLVNRHFSVIDHTHYFVIIRINRTIKSDREESRKELIKSNVAAQSINNKSKWQQNIHQ